MKDLIGKRAESSKNPPVKTGGFVYKRQALVPGFLLYLTNCSGFSNGREGAIDVNLECVPLHRHGRTIIMFIFLGKSLIEETV